MDWIDVQHRIQRGEDEHTELGRFRASNEKEWADAACAFANTDGGLIVLGVTDDGTIDGVPDDPDKVQEQLSNKLQNSLSTPLRARLGRHQDVAGWVHWIEVPRDRGPEPLRYKGRVLVRRGRTNVDPSPSELQELYNAFGLILTEERLIAGSGAVDIEFEAYRRYMARRGIDLDDAEALDWDDELRRAEILEPNLDGRLEASLYGLLCFGREPQRHAPMRSFFVQLAAYAGLDRGDEVLSVSEARGRIDEQVTRAEEWMRGLGRQERYETSHREDLWIVPQRAFREAIVNAVAHRDYSVLGSKVMVDVFDDRVEITSPGGLPNHKRPASVESGGPPRSRNEAIANFLLVHRLMEQRGTGFPRIRKAMRAFNRTEPVLTVHDLERWVRVTLWRRGSETPSGGAPG